MKNQHRKSFFFLSLLFFLAIEQFYSQTPKENAILHYNTVYFEDSLIKKANSYKISLALDSLFHRPLLILDSSSRKIPAFYVSNLNWGASYYWRITAYNNGKIEKYGQTHKLTIMSIKASYLDTVRLVVVKDLKEKNSGGFIAFDNCRTVFDRSGNPVWTIPIIKGVTEVNTVIKDIRLTHDNTFTFLTQKFPVEMDFDGNIIWKGSYPLVLDKDTISYHHDFKKDFQGNYWVLGNKFVYRKLLKELNENVIKNEDKILVTDTGIYRGIDIGLVMKFNKDNELLWVWDANSYIKDVDLNYKLSSSGFPVFSSHMNAFSFNEGMDEVCIGFRDLSRIIKINVKTGKVLASYGERYPSGDAKLANNAFYFQHDCSITKKNNIFILNNNTLSKEPSSILELDGKNGIKNNSVMWRFNLNFDKLTDGKSVKGGNVTELQNGNILVCAGALNRTFEVMRNHEIVWDAFIQFKNNKDTVWKNFQQYRSSYVPKLPIYRFVAAVENYGAKSNGIKKIQLVIHNTGNCDDSYVVKVLNGKGEVITQKVTSLVNVNESYTELLKLPGELKVDNLCRIIITSQTMIHINKGLTISLTDK